MGSTIERVLQFTGAKIGFNPQDRFMVQRGTELVVIRQDGLVFGAEVATGAATDDLKPVFQFRGAKLGFNPQDRFMVTLGFNPLVVIRRDGLVFGANIVGTGQGPHIQPVFQFTGAKIGFSREDRFMVAAANSFGFNAPQNTLVVIRRDGLVFGADVVGRDIQPVFQFSGARIGFNPQDRFMVAMGNRLIVIRQDGLVFGADIVGRNIQPVFQFSGARIGFNSQDRFMVTRGNQLIVVRQDGLVFGALVV
jgi:hypothetical protein